MGRNLFDGSSDSENEVSRIKTNQDYAKSYNKFRGKELLKKLKDRARGSETESSSGEDSESSDEEFKINKRFDEEFYKTLSSLKSKNPEIYNKNRKFFENEDNENESAEQKSKKQKPVTIKDYERKVLLEKGGRFEDDEDMDHVEEERSASPSYVHHQSKLRNEIKRALDSDENEDDEFGGIFRKRDKTKNEKLQEDEEYSAWLAGRKEKIAESAAKTLNPLKQYWDNPSLSKQEQFLRDYVLNHGFHNRDIGDIPTYEEVVADVSADEKEVEKQEEFEQKFNFRFEDPDQEFIKRYPRTIPISVRKQDKSRQEKREAVRERKLKEKEQKFKELEMLKEIKRKEIQEKIQKLKEVTGNDELPFKEDELEEDFDPEAYDRRMQQVFNEEYYGVDEGEEKPECPEIEELKVEDWDNFDPAKDDEALNGDYEPHCEDDDFNMDCDYDPQTAKESLQNELIESTKSRRKSRRRNQFMEMIKKEKPPFNPDDEKTYGEYIDEYYKMDCEDIIGDTPCRFKYVETIPNDFGLTVEEILLAKTKELNQWVSIKKAVQIKTKQAELRDRKLFKMKAKNEALKRKIFTSIYGPPSEDEEETKQTRSSLNEEKTDEKNKCNGDEIKKKKKKKKRNKKLPTGKEAPHTAQDSIKSEGDHTKKEQTIEASKSIDENIEVKTKPPVPEKKKKRKSHAEQQVNGMSKDKESPQEHSLSKKHKNNQLTGKTKQSWKFKNHSTTKADNKETNIYSTLSDDRLKAYGLNPNKFRRQMKFSNDQQKHSQFKKSNSKNKKTNKSNTSS